MFLTKVVEKIKPHVIYSITFFFFENRDVYDILWKNMVEPGRPQMTVQYGAEKMGFACRITKAQKQIHTHNI
jgi:hypothetical protein